MRVYVVIFSVLVPFTASAEDDSKAVLTENPKEMDSVQRTEQKVNNANTETEVKDKLVNLLLSSRNEMVGRMKRIDAIHEVYKTDKMYKTGYLVSFANKLHERLAEMYANIESHKYSWSTLQILDAYEEVKYSTDYLRDVLKVLNMAVSSNLQMLKSMRGTRLRKAATKSPNSRWDSYRLPKTTDKTFQTPEISWSYYDDTIMN